MPKWIEFTEVGDTGKTKTYRVSNKETGANLGIIAWYGAFRKYSFFPANNLVFETQCLMDIMVFLNTLMKERKARKNAKV